MASKLEAPLLGKTGKVSLDPTIFGEPFNGSLVHEVVRAERNAKRSGNASTKSRGEVAMTGAKAWRQKGTGRARVGALSVPHRRGGGVAFGPKPRDYVIKINRKVRRKALRAALSLHAERGTIAVVENEIFSEPCTGDAADALAKWRDEGTVVVLTAGETDRNTALSFRNIGRVRAVLPPDQYGVAELTAAAGVVISKAALDELSAHTGTEVKRGEGPSAEDFEAKAKSRGDDGVASESTESDSTGDTDVATDEVVADEASADGDPVAEGEVSEDVVADDSADADADAEAGADADGDEEGGS
jgi:large subunit ribosomal protein L4